MLTHLQRRVLRFQGWRTPSCNRRQTARLLSGQCAATITWLDHKEPEQRRVAIKCGRRHLASKPLVGNYPNSKQMIPAHAPELAVIPHDRKPGLIPRLRSLGKDHASVRLDWHKRGQLTLSHSAAMQMPVEIHGNPPVVAFNTRYLADSEARSA